MNSLYVNMPENKEKMLKTVKKEGSVGIGKRKEEMFKSRKDNLKN